MENASNSIHVLQGVPSWDDFYLASNAQPFTLKTLNHVPLPEIIGTGCSETACPVCIAGRGSVG